MPHIIFFTLSFLNAHFAPLNYDTCYTLHPNVKFAVNLDGKVWHHVKRPNCPLLNPLKTNRKLHFTNLKYT